MPGKMDVNVPGASAGALLEAAVMGAGMKVDPETLGSAMVVSGWLSIVVRVSEQRQETERDGEVGNGLGSFVVVLDCRPQDMVILTCPPREHQNVQLSFATQHLVDKLTNHHHTSCITANPPESTSPAYPTTPQGLHSAQHNVARAPVRRVRVARHKARPKRRDLNSGGQRCVPHCVRVLRRCR
jgi:hypothetical protein